MIPNFLIPVALAGITTTLGTQLQAQDTTEPAQATLASPQLSLQLEIQRSIDLGLAFLESKQSEDGSWANPETPAFTGLVLSAILNDPQPDTEERTDSVASGFKFLLSKQQEDGGIYDKGLSNYNTALSMMALMAADNPDYLPNIRAARSYIIGEQVDFGEDGVHDPGLDGGIGYGSDPSHSDLSNTVLALEALAYSRELLSDTPEGLGGTELDWDAAVDFVSHCQNLPETNDEPWVSDAESERGGFMYYPGNSKAGEVEGSSNGAQRSYGSMTYAGLLSFLYAEVDASDPRVQAALEWIGNTYSLDENPRMGMQGYYYYAHTMAKALRAAQVDAVVGADGVSHDWREELALQLMNLQQNDGSWVNDDQNRWMENNQVLVTAYTVLALEHIHESL